MNKILGDKDRKELDPLIRNMFKKCPEMMARKYAPANVQQAFILNEILKLNPSKDIPILCVGSFEDTVAEYLKVLDYNVIGIDPEINMSLHKYKEHTRNKFDIIFSTSVIEHVPNDEEFVKDICELLTGTAILTCDFRNSPGPIHPLDCRFYTKDDLLVRLGNIIKQYSCELVGEPHWDDKPNFIYDGYHYSFATWMFKKV